MARSYGIEDNMNRYKVLLAVLIGSAMGPLDGSVVNVAMPTLSKVFNVGMSTVSWVSMSYLLVLSSLLLTYGRLGDMLGYRKLFLWGMLVFTVASALCGLSPVIGVLILARAIQAAGAGMMMAVAPAIITGTFPPSERGKALGFNAMAVAVGLAVGPSLGGFLLYSLGWSYIFFINLPIGIGGFLWARKILPDDGRLKPEKFDPPGAVLGFIFLASLLLYISKGQEIGWSSGTGYMLLIVFILAFTAFIIQEKRAEEPMLDLSLFRNRMFSAGNLSCLFNFIAQNSMIFLTPFFLTQAGFSTNQIGLIMTAFPITVLMVAPVSGVLSDKMGPLFLSTGGALLSAVALYLMSTLTLDVNAFDVVWRLVLFGLGNGLFQTPNNSSVMGSAPKNRQGIASGVLATMRNTGMVLGVALGSGIFTLRHSYYLRILPLTGKALEDAAFMYGLRDAYIMAAVVDILCMLASSVRGKRIEEPEKNVV
ncbi:MFS transporter [Thermoanaerobacterium sp. DL9XJH110]|uniref:MFS transporter n=1 Tax=Thermoanaerobacterium sp. DL9XJH110 TaxID=3386643 RepID=UPI003BB661BE